MDRSKRLKTITEQNVLSDGTACTMTLEREDGQRFELELDLPEKAADLIRALLQATADAGLDKATSQELSDRSRSGVLQLYARTAGLALSGPGHTGFGFRFGVLDLVFALANPKLQSIAADLTAAAASAGQEPKSVQ